MSTEMTPGIRATYKQRYQPDDDGLRFQELVFEGNFVGHGTDARRHPGRQGSKAARQEQGPREGQQAGRPRRPVHPRRTQRPQQLPGLEHLGRARHAGHRGCLRHDPSPGVRDPRLHARVLPVARDSADDHRRGRRPGHPGHRRRAPGARSAPRSTPCTTGPSARSASAWAAAVCSRSKRSDPTTTSRRATSILKFMQRMLWGKRQDGYILNSQDRYRCQIHEPDFLPTIIAQLVELRAGQSASTNPSPRSTPPPNCSPSSTTTTAGSASATPAPTSCPTAGILILRDLFVNEEVFHWSDVCDDASCPHSYTARNRHRPGETGPARRSGSTTSPRPSPGRRTTSRPSPAAPSSPARSGTPRWARSTRSDRRAEPHLDQDPGRDAQDVRQDLADVPPRPVWNGRTCYYVDMILPYLRQAGTYDEGCAEYDFGRSTSGCRTTTTTSPSADFAQETVPQKIFSGPGYLPFGEGADLRRSKYRWL